MDVRFIKRTLILVVAGLFVFTACRTTAPEGSIKTENPNIGEGQMERRGEEIDTEIPGITITLESGESVVYVATQSCRDGEIIEHESLIRGAPSELNPPPSTARGSSVLRIDFGDRPPDAVTATEMSYIYGLSGGSFWVGMNESQQLTYESEAVYLLPLPIGVLTHGMYLPSLPGQSLTMRGYTLTATWGGDVVEYAFNIALDAQQDR